MNSWYHSLLFPIHYILLSLYPCPPSAVAHWLLSMVIKCKHVLSVVPQLHFAIRAGQWFSRQKSSVIHWRTTSNIYMCILINHYISGFAFFSTPNAVSSLHWNTATATAFPRTPGFMVKLTHRMLQNNNKYVNNKIDREIDTLLKESKHSNTFAKMLIK